MWYKTKVGRMNILIPFSGGIDSTYLIHKRLSEGHKVTTCSFLIGNNENKNKVESIMRELSIKQFKKEFGEDKITVIPDLKLGTFSGNDILTLRQPLFWLFGIIFSIYKKVDSVEIAYICNDCAISYLDDLKSLYKAYEPFCEKNLPELKFPLTKISKHAILSELPFEYKNNTTTCENPTILVDDDKVLEFKYCGHCDTCKKMKRYTEDDEDLYKIYNTRLRKFDKVNKMFIDTDCIVDKLVEVPFSRNLEWNLVPKEKIKRKGKNKHV